MPRNKLFFSPITFSGLSYLVFKLFIMFFMAGFFSCDLTAGKQDNMPEHFFSFPKYFKGQAGILHDKNVSLSKTIFKSGKKEEQIFKSVRWENELKLFTDADINKKAWINLYRTDSILNDSALIVSYTAIDSSLQIKKVNIISFKGEITEINLQSRFENFYYQSYLQLTYYPSTGYKISGEQSIHFVSSHYFDITGKFLNP